MSQDPEKEYKDLIGDLARNLSNRMQGEPPILVDGKPVDQLSYSPDPDSRRRGYLALVAALNSNSPYSARYGLLAYALRNEYGAAALEEIYIADEKAKEAATGEAAPADETQ